MSFPLSSSALGKIMIANGLADGLFLLVPMVRQLALADPVKPLLGDAAETPLGQEFVKSYAWAFAFHGIVRVYCGMGIATDDSRAYLAMASYLLEALPFWDMYLSGDKVNIAGVAPMMFAPILMILTLALRKKNKFGKEP